jgi:1,4-alpha-glucan branching enzyme
VPAAGFWRELANSDASEYGGSGVGNLGGCEASGKPAHGHPNSMEITLPPLGAVFFKPEMSSPLTAGGAPPEPEESES